MDIEDMSLKEIDNNYYFVGDDCHTYAHACISKELGDLFLTKYPDVFNCGGTRIQSARRFSLRYIPEELDMEGFWKEILYFDEYFWDKGYKTFEDFKKGEGFE